MDPLTNPENDFKRGFKAGLTLGITIFTIFFGYSLLAMEKGLPPLIVFLFTLITFAAPAQYAVLDLVGTAASFSQIILVGVLINIRFFVMSLGMSHFVKKYPLRKVLPWAQFVAASTFLLPLFDKRRYPDADFFSFYRGVVCAVVPMTWLGTIAGILTTGNLPPVILFAAPLFFPVYFTTLLVADIKRKTEIFCVVSSFLLAPILEEILPGWGIIAAGAISATAALGMKKWMR